MRHNLLNYFPIAVYLYGLQVFAVIGNAVVNILKDRFLSGIVRAFSL